MTVGNARTASTIPSHHTDRSASMAAEDVAASSSARLAEASLESNDGKSMDGASTFAKVHAISSVIRCEKKSSLEMLRSVAAEGDNMKGEEELNTR